MSLRRTMLRQNWRPSVASSAMLQTTTKRALINRNVQESADIHHLVALRTKTKRLVEQTIFLYIKLGISFSLYTAPGFTWEKTYSTLHLMKPTMQQRGLKTTKARTRVSCKRFGCFFTEGLCKVSLTVSLKMHQSCLWSRLISEKSSTTWMC